MYLMTSVLGVPDGLPQAAVYPLPIINAGFESGDLTGWVLDRHAIEVTDDVSAGLSPHGGQYFAQGDRPGNRDWSLAYQDADVSWLSALIDGGAGLKLTLSWWQANEFPDDDGMVLVRFLDASGAQIGPDHGPPAFVVVPEDTWALQSLEVPMPAGTRAVRLVLAARLISGGVANTAWDDIAAQARPSDLAPDDRTSAVIVFRATAGAPAGVNEALGTSPSVADLVDQDGASTGWALSISGTGHDAADTGAMTYSPLVPGSAPWAHGNLLVRDSTGAVTLHLAGLDPARTYDVSLFASRDNSSPRDTIFTVGAASRTVDAAYNINDIAGFSGVVPDISGQIDVVVAVDAGTSTWGYLSAMRITET